MKANKKNMLETLPRSGRVLVYEYLDEIDKNTLLKCSKYFKSRVKLDKAVLKVFKFYYDFHYNYLYTIEDLFKFTFEREDIVDTIIEKFKDIPPSSIGKAVGLYYNFWHSRVGHTKQVYLSIKNTKYEAIMEHFFTSLKKFFKFNLNPTYAFPVYLTKISTSFHKLEVDLSTVNYENLAKLDSSTAYSFNKLTIYQSDAAKKELAPVLEAFSPQKNKLVKLKLTTRTYNFVNEAMKVIEDNYLSLQKFFWSCSSNSFDQLLTPLTKCLGLTSFKFDLSNLIYTLEENHLQAHNLNVFALTKLNLLPNITTLHLKTNIKLVENKLISVLSQLKTTKLEDFRLIPAKYTVAVGEFIRKQRKMKALTIISSFETEELAVHLAETLNSLLNLKELNLVSDLFYKTTPTAEACFSKLTVNTLESCNFNLSVFRNLGASACRKFIESNPNLKKLIWGGTVTCSEETVSFLSELDKILELKIIDRNMAKIAVDIVVRNLEECSRRKKNFFDSSYDCLLRIAKAKVGSKRKLRFFFENMSELTIKILGNVPSEEQKTVEAIGKFAKNISDLRIMRSTVEEACLKRIMLSFCQISALKYLKLQDVDFISDDLMVRFLEGINTTEIISISLRDLGIGLKTLEKVASLVENMPHFKNFIFIDNKTEKDKEKFDLKLIKQIISNKDFFAIQIDSKDFDDIEALDQLVKTSKHIKFIVI